jgi:hypothetical protein
VRAATTLAFSSSALEAHVAAQLAPVRGIERSQLRPDWHGYAASFVVQLSIAARALLSTVNTSLAKLRNDGTLKMIFSWRISLKSEFPDIRPERHQFRFQLPCMCQTPAAVIDNGSAPSPSAYFLILPGSLTALKVSNSTL